MNNVFPVNRAGGALANGLQTAQRVHLAGIGVLHDVAALLAPLTVPAVPKAQQSLLTVADAAVDRGYDVAATLVSSQYDVLLTALGRFSWIEDNVRAV